MYQSSLVFAAFLILLSELFLVSSGMVIRVLGGELPTEMIVFFRNAFGLLLLMPWLLRKGLGAIKTTQLRFHLMRATVGVAAMSCLYYSWQVLPLAQAALLKQTSPFFMPIIALWWLGERIPAAVRWSILIGFIGVFLILNPVGSTLNFAVVIALVGAALGATAKVVIRRMRSTESPQQIVFYFAFFGTCVALIPAVLNWVTPSLENTFWLFVMAITSTLAQLFLSKAYGMAPAGQLGPFTYASVVFAALAGWLLWEETLEVTALIGMLIVFIAGLISVRTMKKKKQAA